MSRLLRHDGGREGERRRAARSRQAHIDAEFHPDGYNIGVNIGRAAGQSRMHVHVHLIPRYTGDVADPSGGIRCVLSKRVSALTRTTAGERRTPCPAFSNAEWTRAHRGRRREGARDGRGHPRRDRGARRRGGARTVGEIRQVVAGEFQADARRRSRRPSARSPSATSTTSGSRRRRCATSRRSSATR